MEVYLPAGKYGPQNPTGIAALIHLTAAAIHAHTGKWLLPGPHDIMARLC